MEMVATDNYVKYRICEISNMPSLKSLFTAGTACLFGASGYFYVSGNPWFYKHVVMPTARRMDPERAHVAAVYLASKGYVCRDRQKDQEILRTTVWGRKFANPIGLAAGFDKHAEAYRGMLVMGFGFVEVGSITPQPQAGNPKPRVFRLTEDKAIINRYGFNSHGHDTVRGRLKNWKEDTSTKDTKDKHLGVSLGKNKTSKDAADDYVQGVKKLGEFADYLVINVSSPNTPGLRDLQGREELSNLLDRVVEERDKLPQRPPLLVKIAPDLTSKDKEDIVAVILREKGGVDGLVVTNTTSSRHSSLCSVHSKEKGGLSGEPLKNMATDTIREMYTLTKGQVPIIGVGGVSSGRDAFEKISAGASLIQLYTALSYEGPPLVRRIKDELADILQTEGYSHVSDAVGAYHKSK